MATKSFTLNCTHFDFRRSRVRSSKDGKTWYIEDKFSLAYILRHIDYYMYLYADSIYSYKELKEALLKELKEKNFPNVKFITNEDK